MGGKAHHIVLVLFAIQLLPAAVELFYPGILRFELKVII